jgi:hypothetical protein
MTAIGNHEIGYSGSWIPGADSGGECGVPYAQYFRMPAPANTGKPDTPWFVCLFAPMRVGGFCFLVFWFFGFFPSKFRRASRYSFTHGPVTFVVMSSEHNFTMGTPQYEWLAAALGAVDRSVTPWLVFAGHRVRLAPLLSFI